MKQFAELFAQLDGSTSTLHKVQALRAYFQTAPAADAAWAVYFLSGGKPKRTVPTRTLREVALQVSGLPDWLFEESYQAGGDLAETIAHVLPVSPHAQPNAQGLAWWMEHRILPCLFEKLVRGSKKIAWINNACRHCFFRDNDRDMFHDDVFSEN